MVRWRVLHEVSSILWRGLPSDRKEAWNRRASLNPSPQSSPFGGARESAAVPSCTSRPGLDGFRYLTDFSGSPVYATPLIFTLVNFKSFTRLITTPGSFNWMSMSCKATFYTVLFAGPSIRPKLFSVPVMLVRVT